MAAPPQSRRCHIELGGIEMNRRQFLAASLATAGAAALNPPTAWAASADAYNSAFNAALKDQPWLVGFESATRDMAVPDVLVEGRMPAGLAGSFYRNGPARHDFAGQRYHHWFDGDGMVHRYHIANGKVNYVARFVRTQKFEAEQAAGKFLYDGGGTTIEGASTGSGPDSINVANTNILYVNGELWALWEAGSAHALDPVTLATKGVVTLNEQLKGAPFSAHPRIGADGRIWNIGSLGNKMALYRLSARGVLEQFNMIDIDAIGLVHDFFLTEKSVVIVLPSSDMNGSGESFFGRVQSRTDKPMQVIVADRETLQITRRAELPSGYWFHGGNAWEEAGGTLHFDISLIKNADSLQGMRAYMRGDISKHHVSPAITTRFSIAPNGKATSASIAGDGEFPRIDQRFGTKRNRSLFMIERSSGNSIWYDTVRHINLETGKIDRFIYGREHLAEEHVFVPRPGSSKEGDGWLVGTTLHWPSRRTCLNILDAQRLSDGPIARAWLPMPAPLGFHGQFAAG
jgi:all-trans-8'-apo-beta-carotenal 15,15'-oxygenase